MSPQRLFGVVVLLMMTDPFTIYPPPIAH